MKGPLVVGNHGFEEERLFLNTENIDEIHKTTIKCIIVHGIYPVEQCISSKY